MKTNNALLKQIALNLGLEEPTEPKSDNWYLKQIEELTRPEEEE